MYFKQANSENCGPPPGNNFDVEVGQFDVEVGQFDVEVGQCHCMVPIERACHKYHACQISILQKI